MENQQSDEKKLDLFSAYTGTMFLEQIRAKRKEALKLVQEKSRVIYHEKKLRVEKLEEDVKRRELERLR